MLQRRSSVTGALLLPKWFFLIFCHKHYWNHTSCSYHQHAPIKTHILLSVVLGWTCLNQFSASLSAFISLLCWPWEYKRVLRDTSSWKGVFIHCIKCYRSRPRLAVFYTHYSSAKKVSWVGKKKDFSLGPAPHAPTHLLWSKVTIIVGLSFYRLAFDTQLIRSCRALSDCDVGSALHSPWHIANIWKCTHTHAWYSLLLKTLACAQHCTPLLRPKLYGF